MAISPKLLNPGERLIFSAREHPKALFGSIFALVFFLGVGVAAQVLVEGDEVAVWTTRVVWILCVLAILWWSVRPALAWLTTVHGVTNRRIITRWGILTRRGHDIPLARVSDISIEIHLLDRLFGCGTLLIDDASANDDVRLKDIPRVEEAQRQINELLHRVHSGRADEGA